MRGRRAKKWRFHDENGRVWASGGPASGCCPTSRQPPSASSCKHVLFLHKPQLPHHSYKRLAECLELRICVSNCHLKVEHRLLRLVPPHDHDIHMVAIFLLHPRQCFNTYIQTSPRSCCRPKASFQQSHLKEFRDAALYRSPGVARANGVGGPRAVNMVSSFL